MPNNHVFTGMDGAITVAVEAGVEGDAAKAVSDAYGLTPIGRATGVTVEVSSVMRPFHEMGQRYATELRPGNVNVTGTMQRAHVNGALLKLMLGEGGAGSRPAGAFASPAFNLSLRMANPALPDNHATVNVYGVKLDGWTFGLPEDDIAIESVSFKALWISVEDAGN
jgi:hypothetical protein